MSVNSETISNTELKVSQMAENLIGSEIIKLAGEIKQKIANGEKINNFTIGDFNPEIYPIPARFKELIIEAYNDNHTNYPAANGIPELRNSISKFISDYQGLNYSPEEILVSGGSRPLIYATYQALIDPQEKVLFPVPSWNNNHYTHLSHANPILVETKPENNFMPTADELRPYIQEANFLALCSPLNPTGTCFGKEQLVEICDMVCAENQRRGENEKPLYILYDQIYWLLTHGETKHCDPVSIRPELRDYTIFIDGLSKSFAATGVRVGWAFGPEKIIGKMKSILGHVGAWSPKAEQVAASKYLTERNNIDTYLTSFKKEISDSLNCFYNGFKTLKNEGFNVDAIPPQAAIYLTVKIDILGKEYNNIKIANTKEATGFILNKAGLAIVPFYAFGSSDDSVWFRLSVGTAKPEQIGQVFSQLRDALKMLN